METCPGPLTRLAVVSLLRKHPGFFSDTICLTGEDDTRAALDLATAEKHSRHFSGRFKVQISWPLLGQSSQLFSSSLQRIILVSLNSTLIFRGWYQSSQKETASRHHWITSQRNEGHGVGRVTSRLGSTTDTKNGIQCSTKICDLSYSFDSENLLIQGVICISAANLIVLNGGSWTFLF